MADEDGKGLSRRSFLQKILTGSAAVIAGTQGLDFLSFFGKKDGKPGAVLTTSGKLAYAEEVLPESIHSHMAHPLADPNVRKGIPGKKWVMVFDLAKCDGCAKCTWACSKMHFVPQDRRWIKVLRMQDAEHTAPYFFPQPCYQCDNPPCTKVCPVDATFKREDGIVLIDNKRCIGCRFCMAACPYGARSFNWDRPEKSPEMADAVYSPEWGYPRRVGTVEKCDFCPDMAAQGQLPACASTCPMGVIYYGDQNEDAVTNSKGETVRLSQFLKDNAGYRFLEDLGTEPRVYYLPPKSRMFPAPGEDEENKNGMSHHHHD